MELVPGGTLRDMLRSTPQLPIDRALWIALDLADADARFSLQLALKLRPVME